MNLREKKNGLHSRGSHCSRSGQRRRNDYQGHLLAMLIAAILIDASQGRLSVVPQDTVTTNNSATLHCKSDEGHPLKWFAQKYGSSKYELWSGYRLINGAASYCNVTSDSRGSYDLILTSTSNQTAGQRYVCEEPGSFQEASAEVVVINPEPKCSRISTYEFFNLTCTVKFRGNIPPIMVWTKYEQDCRNGSTGAVVTEGVNTTVIPDLHVTSSLILPENDSYAKYICTTVLVTAEAGQSALRILSYYSQWIYEHKASSSVASDGPPSNLESSIKIAQLRTTTQKAECSGSNTECGTACVAVTVVLIIMLVTAAIMVVYIFVRKKCQIKEYVSITIHPNTRACTPTENMEGNEKPKDKMNGNCNPIFPTYTNAA